MISLKRWPPAGPEHPATTRAGHYRNTGQPVFSRTLQKEVRAWLKRRERERAKQSGMTPPTTNGTDAGEHMNTTA